MLSLVLHRYGDIKLPMLLLNSSRSANSNYLDDFAFRDVIWKENTIALGY